MIYKSKIVISLICLISCMISIVIVYKYPVVDWISSPLLINFILIPILLCEIVAIFLITLRIKILFTLIVQIIISIIAIVVMANYIRIH